MLLTRVRDPLAIGDTNAASAASLHAGAAASPGREDASLPRLMRRERADGPPSTPASRRRSVNQAASSCSGPGMALMTVCSPRNGLAMMPQPARNAYSTRPRAHSSP